MQDKPMSSKPRALGLAVLALGAAIVVHFSGGRAVQAHPPERTAAGAAALTDPQTRVLDMATLSDMDGLIEKLADRRVVFVGETHDRYDHHLNQLAIIEGLHGQDPRLAIGLEFFQQPFQEHLDRYVSGEIDERDFLKETEYFERWRYDYRLYRPILRFARDNEIPLVALNVPRELTERVASAGIEGLSAAEREYVPAELDRDDATYRRRILEVFENHPGAEEKNFEHFLEAQLLWDEGMADRAARYLREHPEMRMVVLAGTGHVEYGQGIPNRLLRRLPVAAAIVINASHPSLDPELADFMLFPRRVELPRTGLLGVVLDTERDGVKVRGFADDSPAERAGLKKGDRILKVAGATIDSYSDIRLALMDHEPGEEVPVEVVREGVFLGDEHLSYRVKLF
jgi:uncharacterized iron-regulated protein